MLLSAAYHLTAHSMGLTNMLMDHLGFFYPHQVLNAVVAMLVAAMLGWLLGRVGGRLPDRPARGLALWAALATMALTFVRTNLPVAVALVAVALLVRGAEDGSLDRRSLFGALVIGVACGSGAMLGAVAVGLPLILLFRWANAKG